MKSRQLQQGMAIALLLWMVAGMALTVAAITHLASGDTDMAELRIKEARSLYLGRGAAVLAVDAYSALTGPAAGADSTGGVFERHYRFGEFEVAARVRPTTAYVSLNSASESDLEQLFHKLGGGTSSQAEAMAAGVVTYRNQASLEGAYFPGFRFVEELMAVPGARRAIYDRVKGFVHPYGAGQVDARSAPAALAGNMDALAGQVDSTGDSPAPDDKRDDRRTPRQAGGGRITFDTVFAQKLARQNGGNGYVVETVTTFPDGSEYRGRVWLDGASGAITRSEVPTVIGSKAS